ncbi:caspase family protein, partial [Myxococcota bacterium]|nr:caspase family protein [Myxococcota bacterium]
MRRWRAVVFLYALSVSITWAQAWPDQMTVAQGAKDGAKDAALIVAIENYEHVSGVTGARRNAAAWKAWLEQTRGVPYVKVLLDSQAKHGWKRGGKAGGILADVEQMARKVKKGGMLWFVFIGHGAPGEGGEGGLLLGADVEQTVESFEMRGLPVKSELLPRLRKAPQAVAILDACFSGLDGGGRRFIKDLQPVLHAKLNSVPGNVIVLTAAKSDQFAGPLPGASRPAFSYLALGALRGWADSTGQGVITAGDVRRYV